MRSTPTRRRWFQFGLRSLLAFVVLVAMVAAWVGYERRQSRRELKIATRLMEQGATVELVGLFYFGDEIDPPPIPDLAPSWWRKGLSDLCGLRVHDVNLWTVRAGPESFALLADLGKMTDLNIGITEIADLAPLANLRNLKSLQSQDNPVDDLSPLARLDKLELLLLDGTNVSDLTPLAGLTELTTLSINRTRVRDLAPLADLKKLKSLDLCGTQVNDLTPLAGLMNLRFLDVSDSSVGAEHVHWLKQRLPDCEVIITTAPNLATPVELPEE